MPFLRCNEIMLKKQAYDLYQINVRKTNMEKWNFIQNLALIDAMYISIDCYLNLSTRTSKIPKIEEEQIPHIQNWEN